MHIDSEIKVSPPYHCQFSEDRVSDQFISNGFMCTLFFFLTVTDDHMCSLCIINIYILYNLPVAPCGPLIGQ